MNLNCGVFSSQQPSLGRYLKVIDGFSCSLSTFRQYLFPEHEDTEDEQNSFQIIHDTYSVQPTIN